MMQRWAFLGWLSMAQHVLVVEASHCRRQNRMRTCWLEQNAIGDSDQNSTHPIRSSSADKSVDQQQPWQV